MSRHAVALAVLPFRNLSGDPEQDYFAHGFVDDLITELARFPSLEVVGGHAVLGLDDQRPGIEVARELGAALLLQGSIRRLADVLRVNAQLVEVDAGRHRWAESFEAPVERLFAIQDEIVSSVAGTLAVRIDETRLGHARRLPLGGLAAYDCWLRGLECLRRGTLEGDEEARGYFQRALELDPHYARAWAGLSLTHFNEWSCQVWHLWDESVDRAFDHARHAAELDDGDPVVHLVLGRIRLYRREFEAARRDLERALALNPNDPDLLAHLALQLCYLGEPERALALGEKAVRLHPLHENWYAAGPAMAYLLLRRFDEALALAGRVGRMFVDSAAFEAVAAAYAGDGERARRALAVFAEEFRIKIAFGRDPDPGERTRWFLHVNPFRRAEDVELVTEGLRRAGLEEPAAPLLPPPAIRPAEVELAGNLFRRESGFWTLAFEGRGAQITEVKGLGDLARLLERPGIEVHCLELYGAPATSDAGAERLDRRARLEVEERIRELQGELERAEAGHDLGRAERLREELDALVDELARAFGLGGRARKLGDPAERARTAVTWRIRSAVKKIAAAHPRLARHLDHAVRTGTFCVYAPESPTSWQLS